MGARFTEHVCMQRAPRRPRAQVDAKTCKGTCGKTKAITDFYTDQCVCKDCVHVERKLLRRASAQGEEDYVKKLKREEPKEFSKLCKAFGKAVKPGQKAQSFCVASWKRHVGVRSGQRSSLKRKWMWEREYVEFQGTTAQGSGNHSVGSLPNKGIVPARQTSCPKVRQALEIEPICWRRRHAPMR